MGEVRRTLIPQFSLRVILGIVSALALVAFVTSAAGRGWAWAAGVSIGLLAVVIALVVYAILFAFAWLFAAIFGRRAGKQAPSKNISPGGTTTAVLLLIAFHACAPAARGASGGSI